ncbi:beta-N-acetylhexosaminidase [Aquabacterium lacunae]|uniref:Beta-hexosaminidase n=1 Tax=Aquabacterium lacunae TaxID=2528630 RepID=A0A4Q9GZQ3_9BURK|nr:beta-N-acetylhexosaminidase [Aquabacterium lacunae]TBO32499.1 beta-N-acetylhexosaminidase [Aquabacterium lacunae]
MSKKPSAVQTAAKTAAKPASKPTRDAVAHAPVVLDIEGLSLNDDDRRRLQHPLTGGLILFGRNWQSRAQVTALCAEIKSIRPDVLISVDHEGGRVQRFRTDGFTHLPPMRALGEMWMNDGRKAEGTGAMLAMDAASACGYVLAAELRACGVDMSFTPVLDLDWGPSGVIGDRAFHGDARVATMLARAVMQGLLHAGMANCGKHFPGHGFVAADSHTEIPVDKRSLKAILADDAKPYEWLSTVLTSVMPAHVIYPKVDAAPAGFSKKWLQDILRAQLGFTGAIFSDDLSMEGASVAGSHTQGAIAALNAGCDLVLLCNQSLKGGQAVDALLDGLQAALARGEWEASADSEARRLDLLPQTAPMAWDELMVHGPYLQALSKLPR